MKVSSPNAIFVDTSIQVDRFHREPPMQSAIEKTLDEYEFKISSRIVLQEYKRRVLAEAVYLLNKLRSTGSFRATVEHVTSVLPAQSERKRKVCLAILISLWPDRSDVEHTERAQRYLRTLILHGQRSFQDSLDLVLEGTGCYWATYGPIEKKPYSVYDLGRKKCSASAGRCTVSQFLDSKMQRCRDLLAFLDGIAVDRRTKELEGAIQFLRGLVSNENVDWAPSQEPCLSVGDLLIALESDGFENFYTKNYKESLTFCDFLGQNLIIRPNEPSKSDIKLRPSDKPWPSNPSS